MKKIRLPLKDKNVKSFVLLVALVVVSFFLGTRQGELRQFFQNPRAVLQPTPGGTITARQLAGLLKKKNFTFINVHTPYEGEIEKTDSFVSYDQIVANAANLPKDKSAPIILYCKTGRMSQEALATFQKLGYTNVRQLAGGMDAWKKAGKKLWDLSLLEKEVLPEEGFTLPVSWGDVGPRLVELGVIDLVKFKEVVQMTPEEEKILTEGSAEKIIINGKNSQFVVDLLWALGLAQQSLVYEEGPMGKEYKKDVGNFASTGGWNLARGDAVNYLGKFDLIQLTPEEQKQVGEIAKNVYRPCCGNPTWFPDCNHGMAALAAIELMVAAGMNEKDIYRNILALNSFWFPDTYLIVATFFARQEINWSNVDAKEILGSKYSSGQGAGEIAKKVGPLPYRPTSGGGCGT